jgi:hypothetical protein
MAQKQEKDMDSIPERLRTDAEGVAKATQMMADAKSKRNGDGACYRGLKPEETYQWQAADMIERYEKALRGVEEWWLTEGMKHFTGAPYAIYAVRTALADGEH